MPAGNAAFIIKRLVTFDFICIQPMQLFVLKTGTRKFEQMRFFLPDQIYPTFSHKV